ncbi:transcription termination factor, mitochondrial [Caerostris darwini]|uniref:Transcription termination factor, mitochondrial n=1 Tax=Caerostris darwini TaxID=1538125 RepID=A0AAV4W1L1_9ARAC|nr:transcription termination factor, mitochondrial [Caerostris darwini]
MGGLYKNFHRIFCAGIKKFLFPFEYLLLSYLKVSSTVNQLAMKKTQPILLLLCSQKYNLTRPTFRTFCQVICKSRFNYWNVLTEYKVLLVQAEVLMGTRAFLRNLNSISMTDKDAFNLSDSLLNEITNTVGSEKKDELLKVIKFLQSHGCSEKNIKTKYLNYILGTQSSYIKILLLTDLHSNIFILLPLLSLHLVSLRTASKLARQENNKIGFPNRIEYLSFNLNIDPADLVPILAKHPSLLTMPFSRLQLKMTILKEAKISPEYIVKDLWIFNYNENLLENRITAARNAKVELKPWMLRCSEKFFESKLARWSQTQDILKGDNEISYLAKKLDCTEEYIQVIMVKNKLLKTINIPKLEQVINFLYEKGYTPQEVRLFPKVFCSSVQTLRKRFDDFQNFRNTLPTMSQLCISSKKFESISRKKDN